MHGHLSRYFENNDILCKEQGGLRKGMDTSNTIFELVDYINTGFNLKKGYCIAAFADLAIAFDSIDRTLLLKKLKLYGIKGNLLNLLTDYLSNRKQRVNLNGTLSDLKSINYGVPRVAFWAPSYS